MFMTKMANPRAAYYSKDNQNQKFSDALALALKGDRNGHASSKFTLSFCRGTIVGANIFDNRLLLVPYLPNTEDKDCPQFEIETNRALGASVDRAITNMSVDSVTVTEKHGMIGMGYRLWARCQRPETRAQIDGLPGIPVWLVSPAEREGMSPAPAVGVDLTGATPGQG